MKKEKINDMINNKIYTLGTIPFMVGPTTKPHNAHKMPDSLPFSYFKDEMSSVLKQSYSNETDKHLQTAYEKGSILAIPMDVEGEGSHYLFDFLSFIEKSVSNLHKKEVLEIGCGRGFLVKILQQKTAKVMGIEPGKNQRDCWKENNIKVINDFFPSPKLKDHFDLIITFCVLEHIYEADNFIKAVINQLKDGGQIIFAVPNCEDQINNCDPSMFVHEHYSYFSRESLQFFLERNGMITKNLELAEYGGVIYISAQRTSPADNTLITNIPDFDIHKFATSLTFFVDFIAEEIDILVKQGKSLGIYCPARAITTIPTNKTYRFFDDDKSVYGLYYPPFASSIENRDDLLNNPVDVIWIFSYSFGDKIKNNLTAHSQLKNTEILTLSELKIKSSK